MWSGISQLKYYGNQWLKSRAISLVRAEAASKSINFCRYQDIYNFQYPRCRVQLIEIIYKLETVLHLSADVSAIENLLDDGVATNFVMYSTGTVQYI
jgi:hypothetical protein